MCEFVSQSCKSAPARQIFELRWTENHCNWSSPSSPSSAATSCFEPDSLAQASTRTSESARNEVMQVRQSRGEVRNFKVADAPKECAFHCAIWQRRRLMLLSSSMCVCLFAIASHSAGSRGQPFVHSFIHTFAHQVNSLHLKSAERPAAASVAGGCRRDTCVFWPINLAAPVPRQARLAPGCTFRATFQSSLTCWRGTNSGPLLRPLARLTNRPADGQADTIRCSTAATNAVCVSRASQECGQSAGAFLFKLAATCARNATGGRHFFLSYSQINLTIDRV